MTERDPKVSRRYRELGGEEPPRALDDAILAASRRSVQKRRWNRPIAIAAVIVLAVAVTVHVQREQPDQEALSVPSANVLSGMRTEEARDMAKAEKATPPPQPAAALPQPAPASPSPASPPQEMRDRQAGAAADQRAREFARLDSQRLAHERARLAQERAAQEAALSQEMRGQTAPAAAASKPAPSPATAMRRADVAARPTSDLGKFAQHSPEQWLLAIDDLKRQGKHDEAEKQLAEFRKRYPDYRIPQAITEKFEKR